MSRLSVCLMLLGLAACSQGGDGRSNGMAESAASGEASPQVPNEARGSGTDEEVADLNGGFAEAAATPADEAAVTMDVEDAAPGQLWMGSIGGAGDQSCSSTTGGHIDTTPYLFARDGQGTIVSESTDVVVLATNRVDNGGGMKVVFATSRALCEKARRNAR